MQDVQRFLAKVAASRRGTQAASHVGFTSPPGLRLPPALESAIDHKWLIAPVLGRTAYALESARVDLPSAEREQIEYWAATYPDTNWLLHTGAESAVVALEIELRLARHSLAYLAADDWSWQRTLHFAVQGRWRVLFECVPGLPSLDGYPGLHLHKSGPILIPPSRMPSGIELVYADPLAPLLPAAWLRKAVSLG